jgi:hypothetical protein
MNSKQSAYIVCQAIKYVKKLRKANVPEETAAMMLENYMEDLKAELRQVA